MVKKRPAKVQPRITAEVVQLVRALQSDKELPESELPIGEGSLTSLLAFGWVSRRWQDGSERPAGQRRAGRWMYQVTEQLFTLLPLPEWTSSSGAADTAKRLRHVLAKRISGA